MQDCHICYEEANLLLINRIHTCTTCINKLIRPVVNGSAMYPVMINNEPADLTKHGRHLDRKLFDLYAQMEPQESIPSHLRVHCANQHFAGKRVEASPDGTYQAEISLCEKCKCATCLICKKDLDTDAVPLARLADHGCKAELDAEKEIREEAFEGLERGKDYQFCPTCKRDVQLAAACHHISCLCKTHFCYECGEVLKTGHYKLGKSTLYPIAPPAPAPVPAAEPLELDDVRARYTAVLLYDLYDTVLSVSDEQMQQELESAIQSIGPHRFFIVQQDGVHGDGANPDLPADLEGEFPHLQNQGVDLWLPILGEQIRLVEAEIVELCQRIALADGVWARLPLNLRVDGQERVIAVARRDEQSRERLSGRLRALIGDFQMIANEEAIAARQGNQAPDPPQQRLQYHFQVGAGRQLHPNVASDREAQIDHVAELLRGLNAEDAPDPVAGEEAPAHHEERQLHRPGGYAARRDYWRRRDQQARRRRGRGGRAGREDDYANEG